MNRDLKSLLLKLAADDKMWNDPKFLENIKSLRKKEKSSTKPSSGKPASYKPKKPVDERTLEEHIEELEKQDAAGEKREKHKALIQGKHVFYEGQDDEAIDALRDMLIYLADQKISSHHTESEKKEIAWEKLFAQNILGSKYKTAAVKSENLFFFSDGTSSGKKEQGKILHKTTGPAAEYEDGSKEWYNYGKLHREDGPAIEKGDGRKLWYYEGVQLENPKVVGKTLPEQFADRRSKEQKWLAVERPSDGDVSLLAPFERSKREEHQSRTLEDFSPEELSSLEEKISTSLDDSEQGYRGWERVVQHDDKQHKAYILTRKQIAMIEQLYAKAKERQAKHQAMVENLWKKMPTELGGAYRQLAQVEKEISNLRKLQDLAEGPLDQIEKFEKKLGYSPVKVWQESGFSSLESLEKTKEDLQKKIKMLSVDYNSKQDNKTSPQKSSIPVNPTNELYQVKKPTKSEEDLEEDDFDTPARSASSRPASRVVVARDLVREAYKVLS